MDEVGNIWEAVFGLLRTMLSISFYPSFELWKFSLYMVTLERWEFSSGHHLVRLQKFLIPAFTVTVPPQFSDIRARTGIIILHPTFGSPVYHGQCDPPVPYRQPSGVLHR